MICACLSGGNCTLDGVLGASESTVVMNCECLQGRQAIKDMLTLSCFDGMPTKMIDLISTMCRS